MVMNCFALLLIILLGAPAIYAEDHTVGGDNGWTTGGYNYTAWAAGETFKIGDNLVFNYASNHQVDIVSEDDYTNCVNNPIQNFKGGKTTIPLTAAGPIYFTCPVSDHCTQGQKLAINVTLVTTFSPPPPTSGTTVSPPPPSNTTTPSNGAEGSFGILSKLVLGLSLVMMGLFGQ